MYLYLIIKVFLLVEVHFKNTVLMGCVFLFQKGTKNAIIVVWKRSKLVKNGGEKSGRKRID